MEPDISEEVAARLLDFVDRMDDLVGVCDEQGRVLYMNQAARKHLGVGDVTELTTADFFAPEAFASYYDEVRPALLHSGTWSGELAIRTSTGGSVPMLFSVVAGVRAGGEITGLVTHGRPVPEISPRVETGADATKIIDRDVLTERVREALSRRTETSTAVVYLEVRDMTALSERHGGFVADGVMRTVGRRLTSTVRASDFVARVGRNAFFLLYIDTRDAGEAMRLVKSVEDAFEREPIWSVAGEIPIRLRCGLAIAHSGDEPEAVLGRAQLASTASAPTTPAEPNDDLTILAACDALRPAVMRGEVLTLVRTIVDRQGRVVGYDAFPHWTHPALGDIDVERLETLADRAGVATAIALRVLRVASAYLMTSPAESPKSISVAMSQSMTRDAYVEQYVWEVADAIGIAPDQIVLLVDPSDASPATLRSLRETGARVAARNIDRASDVVALVTDHQFVDLRLSERLIAQIDTDEVMRREMQQVATLAQDAGARVTAPGVRTSTQRDALLDAGVDLMTGSYFGSPVTVESVT